MAGVAAHMPQARIPAAALKLLGDDRLVRLAASGDSRAFEVIYERYHQPLYRYCRSIVVNPEDAADALQSAMASALRGLTGERRQIELRPWLFRIAHNESVSLLRKRRPHATIDDALELEAPAHDPSVKQRLKELVSDLRELPDGQRSALVMHELSGLPYREVAAALDTTEPHARQLVYEARTALHDLAEGRAMECESVRRTISDGDRRVLRGRRIRSHLRTCSGCAGFEQLIRSRKRDLAAIAPPIPAALAAGLLHKVLGGGGSGGTGAAIGSSGGAALAGKGIAASALSKGVAVVAITAAAGAGAVEIAGTTKHPSHRASGAAPVAAPAAASHAAARVTAVSAPSRSSIPGTPRRHAASNSHGKAGSAPGHTKTGHPAHPTHPLHPTHPVKQSYPVHPTHPAKPTHPVKPTHPTHPTKPVKPVHPTHPAKPAPAPKSKAPATTGGTPTTPADTTPPGQQKNAESHANSGGGSKVKGLLNLVP